MLSIDKFISKEFDKILRKYFKELMSRPLFFMEQQDLLIQEKKINALLNQRLSLLIPKLKELRFIGRSYFYFRWMRMCGHMKPLPDRSKLFLMIPLNGKCQALITDRPKEVRVDNIYCAFYDKPRSVIVYF